MRKLPDWLLQEQTTLEASKSHHYLQMNLHTLRHFLGKMKQTTPAFKAKTSSWMRLVYFLTLAILITTAHHTIQLWILGILLLLHIAMLPGEALLHLFKVLVKVLLFSAIVILPSILFQGFQNGGLFLLRAGIIVLNISLFLATTTSVQLVDALRQLHVPKTFVQTIDITLKYSYILGKHLHQQIECVQLRTVGQKVSLHLFGSLLGLLYLSTKNHTKEVYEAMLLGGYGMDRKQKEPFCWKKEDGLLLLELVFLIAVTTLFR